VWATTPNAIREMIIAVVLLALIMPPFKALVAYNSQFSDADAAALRSQFLMMAKAKSDRQKPLVDKKFAELPAGRF
jgi:hypothetical protein